MLCEKGHDSVNAVGSLMCYVKRSSLDVIEQKLKTDICNIVNWCDDNRMAFNCDKTKAILITKCQKLDKLPMKQLNITVKRKVLENVKLENFLA